MKWCEKIPPMVGNHRTRRFFAILPWRINDGVQGTCTYWLQYITVTERYTASWGGSWWDTINITED